MQWFQIQIIDGGTKETYRPGKCASLRQSLKFLFLHVSCLIFSEKKRYPWSMCRRKHGEKAQTLVTLPQNTTKKSTYKRELALQREV